MKRMLRFMLVALLVMSLVCSSALAAKADKQYDKLCKMVEKANAKVEKLVEHAQKTEKDDVDWLLDKVDDIVEPVFAYADEIGETVVCKNVEYWIDGRWVEVDPLKVINEYD